MPALPDGGVVPVCSVPLHKAECCIFAAFGDAQVDLALDAQYRVKSQGSSISRSKSAGDKYISEGHIALVPQTRWSLGAPSQWGIVIFESHRTSQQHESLAIDA